MTRFVLFSLFVASACQAGEQVAQKPMETASSSTPAHDKSSAESAAQKPKPKAGPGTIVVAHDVAWMKAYLTLGEALVHSDATRASAAAEALIASGAPANIQGLLNSFAKDLKAQRLSFAKVSAEVRQAWAGDAALQKATVVMHCPMVPADWIQAPGALRNPYMPDTMLRCGYQVAPKNP
jgi:hypothetical protein